MNLHKVIHLHKPSSRLRLINVMLAWQSTYLSVLKQKTKKGISSLFVFTLLDEMARYFSQYLRTTFDLI